MFGNAFVQTFDNPTAVALFKLLLGEAFRRPSVAQVLNQIGPSRGFAFLTHYLQHQMDLGTLRRVHPGAATRSFMGPMLAYILSREVLHQPDSQSLSAETMVATAVDIFLQGMQPGQDELRRR
jgi:TetR/AcrR family transcriptional regulator, mexJK operon transcriptional repressor